MPQTSVHSKSTCLPKIVDTDTLCATAKQLFLILFAAPDDDAGTVALSTISTKISKLKTNFKPLNNIHNIFNRCPYKCDVILTVHRR